jgi:hypothetical protein
MLGAGHLELVYDILLIRIVRCQLRGKERTHQKQKEKYSGSDDKGIAKVAA